MANPKATITDSAGTPHDISAMGVVHSDGRNVEEHLDSKINRADITARGRFAQFTTDTEFERVGQIQGDIPFSPSVERVNGEEWAAGTNPGGGEPDRDLLRLRFSNISGGGGGRIVLDAQNWGTGATAAVKIGEMGLFLASDMGRAILTGMAMAQLNGGANFHMTDGAGLFRYNGARDMMYGGAQSLMGDSAFFRMIDGSRVDLEQGAFIKALASFFLQGDGGHFLMSGDPRFHMDSSSVLRIVNGTVKQMTEQSQDWHRGFDPNRNTPAIDDGVNTPFFNRRTGAQPNDNGALSALYDNSVFFMAGLLDEFFNDPRYPEWARMAAAAMHDSTRARLGVFNTSRVLSADTADAQFTGNSQVLATGGTFQVRGSTNNNIHFMVESNEADTLVHFLTGT
ncbi:MAG: hypothetical protein FWB96_01165, partial [Defluviitaleaceae bacterium]|nr:hypothetical protein [Defluviitaleaceae bacterium]MCL2261698.1 hypothetical protein [Defluviitaleaceae bacterium]